MSVWEDDTSKLVKPHEHDFEGDKVKQLRTKAGVNAEVGSNVNEYQPKTINNGSFCSRCGAWRGQLGLEPTLKLYIEHLRMIFAEVYRVLKPTGTCWVNMGDSYHNATKWTNKDECPQTISNGNNRNLKTGRIENQGLQEKCLMNIPSRFAIMMTDKLQFIQRNEIIWYKRNCIPSSAGDRFTVDFEKVYFFTKQGKYFFEQQFEEIQQASIDRLGRAVSNKNKWVMCGGGDCFLLHWETEQNKKNH